jgi:GAF domain-containing protein
VQPFSEKQIALLQNFAAQAVIAMENARLIDETREALEQQTATAEVLGVINSSPGDLAPVFDAMLEKATALCDAPLGTLWLFDGEHINPMATRGASPELSEFLAGPRPPNPVQQRQLRGAGTIHMTDLKATALYRDGDTLARAVADLGGIQTVLSVPLRRENRVLGLFGVYRQEIHPFSDKQIALIENFAAQAVIAIENARLITETREALEQQTATAEILGVINSSPGDLAPVFDAILEKAHTLCGATLGGLVIFDGAQFRPVAVHAEPQFAQYWRQTSVRPPVDGDAPYTRLMRGERFLHIADVHLEAVYREISVFREQMDVGGIRTLLMVPLRKDDILLGVITAFREKFAPLPTRRSHFCRTLPRKRLSQWRTRGSWASCANAPTRWRSLIEAWRRGSPSRSRSWGALDG